MTSQWKQLHLWYVPPVLHSNRHIMTASCFMSCHNNALFCCSALAGGPQETIPFSEALVCYALLRTEEHSGSDQTCKRQYNLFKYQGGKASTSLSMPFLSFCRESRWPGCLSLMLGETRHLRFPLSHALALWSSI